MATNHDRSAPPGKPLLLPRRLTPEDALRTAERAQALMTNQGAHVRNQHTVSRAVLKQFAEKTAGGVKVAVHNLRYGDTKLKGLAEAGVTRNFVTVDSGNAERVWKQVEDNISEAIAAAEARTILDQPQLVSVLRDALALHYARCRATGEIMNRVWERTRGEYLHHVITQNPDALANAYYRKYGLHPGSQAILRAFACDLIEPVATLIESGAWARVRMEEIFTYLRTHNTHWQLEVVSAGDGEFLIGDVPAVTSRPGATRPGVLGVPLGSATQLVMPLTPRLSISVGPEPLYTVLGRSDVEALNSWQVAAAVELVFHRPSAEVDEFIEQLRLRSRVG